MKILFWHFILCMNTINITMSVGDISRFGRTFHETICNLKINQLSIFTNSAAGANKRQSGAFTRHLVSQFATTTIDLAKMKSTKDNRSLQMPIFRNPRPSTIYVLQSTNFDSNQIYRISDDLVAISPISMRPKSLLVIHNDKNWSALNASKIVRYAWSLKFLDFSILKINTDNRMALLHYNPYTEIYSRFNLKIPKVIFPDKLNDVKCLSLKLPTFNVPPLIMVHNKSNKERQVTGSDFIYIKTVAEKLNFKFNSSFESHNNTKYLMGKLLTNLENNEINIIPVAFLVTTYLQGRKLIIGNSMAQSKMAIVVPIIPVTELKVSFYIFIYMLSFAAIIISFSIFVHLMKFNSDNWEMLTIFQILVGIPIRARPRQGVELIIFFTIVILSISYSCILTSSLSAIQLVQDETQFFTIEDIVQSRIPVYTSYSAIDEDGIRIKKLFVNSKKVQDDGDCINMLIETNNVICIIPYDRAMYFVQKNLKTNGRPIMRIVDQLSFRHDQVAFAYEKASPYAEKFGKGLQLLTESGIPSFWESRIYNGTATIHQLKKSSSANIKDILVIQLIIIACLGCLLSTTVFIYESVRSYVTWMNIMLNIS